MSITGISVNRSRTRRRRKVTSVVTLIFLSYVAGAVVTRVNQEEPPPVIEYRYIESEPEVIVETKTVTVTEYVSQGFPVSCNEAIDGVRLLDDTETQLSSAVGQLSLAASTAAKYFLGGGTPLQVTAALEEMSSARGQLDGAAIERGGILQSIERHRTNCLEELSG